MGRIETTTKERKQLENQEREKSRRRAETTVEPSSCLGVTLNNIRSCRVFAVFTC